MGVRRYPWQSREDHDTLTLLASVDEGAARQFELLLYNEARSDARYNAGLDQSLGFEDAERQLGVRYARWSHGAGGGHKRAALPGAA